MKYGIIKIQMTTSPPGNADRYIDRIRSAHAYGADIVLFSGVSAIDGKCLTDVQIQKIARAVAPRFYAVLCAQIELDGFLRNAAIVLNNGRALAVCIQDSTPAEILIGKYIVTVSPSLYIKTESGVLAVLGDCLNSPDKIKKASSSADALLLSCPGDALIAPAAAVKYYSDLYSCPVLYCSGDSPANTNAPELKCMCAYGSTLEQAYSETLTVDVDLEIAQNNRSEPLYIDPAAAYVQATLPSSPFALENIPEIYPYIGNGSGKYNRMLDSITNRICSEFLSSKKTGICLYASIGPEAVALIIAAARAAKKMSEPTDMITVLMPDYGDDALPLTDICDYLGINYMLYNRATAQEMTVIKCSDKLTPMNKLKIPAPDYFAACGYADSLDALLIIPFTKSLLSSRSNAGFVETAFNPLFDTYSSAMLKLIYNIAAVSNSEEFAKLLRQALKNTDPRKLAAEDFVLHHAIINSFSPDKILYLSKHAFSDIPQQEIRDIYDSVIGS